MARVRLWRRGTRHYLLKLNHSKANPYPRALQHPDIIPLPPSSRSATLFATFPAEIVSEIAGVVFTDTLFWDETVRSWNYTFIAFNKVLKHQLLQICQSWRNIILQFIVSSRQNRQGIYLAATTHQLLLVARWYPNIELRGCLLLLGSPNDLLMGPTDDLDNTSTLFAHGNILDAVEAVEWLEASTAGFSYVGDPPNIESALMKFCEAYANRSGFQSALEENTRLLCEAIVPIAYNACSKVLDLLSLLPHVKMAEMPIWVMMVAALTDTFLSREQQESLMGNLGLKVVTSNELRASLRATLLRLERLNIAGYSFGLLGVFPYRTEATWLEEHVGIEISNMEVGLRRRFLPSTPLDGPQTVFPPGSLDHLKGVAWRDNSLDETVEYENPALQAIFGYSGQIQLDNFFAINKDDPRKLVAAPVSFPHLDAPVFKHSMGTLRSLTLHLSFDLTEFVDGGQPPHHCALISSFSELLPSLQYLDISTPPICESALHGRFTPRQPAGTFKLNILSEPWPSCSPHVVTYHTATWGVKGLLDLMKASQAYSEEAKGWNIELHLSSPDEPRNVPEGPPRTTLILLPQESRMFLSLLHLHTKSIRLRKPTRDGRIQDTSDKWIWRNSEVTLASLEAWMKDGHENESWKVYPWNLEGQRDMYTPLEYDDQEG